MPLWELQEALSGARRVDRRVGLLCLGCGLPPVQCAAVLGIDEGLKVLFKSLSIN